MSPGTPAKARPGRRLCCLSVAVAVPSCRVTGCAWLMSPAPLPPCFLFHSSPPGSSSRWSSEKQEEKGPESGGAGVPGT